MLDTHAVARSLTDAEFTPAQADAITNAVRLAAEVAPGACAVEVSRQRNFKRDRQVARSR